MQRFFSRPKHTWQYIVAGSIPFILLVLCYSYFSYERHQINPMDKLIPSYTQLYDGIKKVAFEPNRDGEYMILNDSIISLKMFVTGLTLAIIVGSFFGISMGIFGWFDALFNPFMKSLAQIPPFAILSILLLIVGTGFWGKVFFIFLGNVFVITQEVYNSVKALPLEQFVKAMTLGGDRIEVIHTVVIPQLVPRILMLVRSCIGATWSFLLVAEMITATEGLGCRIFLSMRYMNMNIILPYVAWILLLGIAMNYSIKWYVEWRYKWSLNS